MLLREYYNFVPAPEDVLSKSQRNDLFRAVEKSGIPLTELELKAGTLTGPGKKPCVWIEHRNSQSYFGVAPLPKGVFQIFGRLDDGEKLATDADRSGLFMRALDLRTVNFNGWHHVPPLAAKWAHKIIKVRDEYVNTPDLWAELRDVKEILAVPHENTPFSVDEQARISDQIQAIKAYITTTYKPTTDQLSDIEQKLEHAEEASRRLGRKDWLVLFNGAVFSLILADLIPPQAAQHIFILILQGIGYLFGLGGPPTPLP